MSSVPNLIPPQGNARQRLIETAEALFYQRGIRAVGVDEIIAEAKVAKATLYRLFGGKEQLILAYLARRGAFARARLSASATQSSYPAEQILDAFRALEHNVENPNFRGCAFLLAVSEHGELESVRTVGRDHKLFVRDHFAALAKSAGISDADIAEKLALIYEGALATAVVRPEARSGKTALSLVKTLLNAAVEQERQA